MKTPTLFALPLLLLFAAGPARADCHWAWHCVQPASCGFVPFCDSPQDKPGPLRGARLPGDMPAAPVPPTAHPARKPLPGYKPVNPPPPGPSLPPPSRQQAPPEVPPRVAPPAISPQLR